MFKDFVVELNTTTHTEQYSIRCEVNEILYTIDRWIDR